MSELIFFCTYYQLLASFFPYGSTAIDLVTFGLWMRRLRHREVNVTCCRRTEIGSVIPSCQALWPFYCTMMFSNISYVFCFPVFNRSLRLLFVHGIYFALSHHWREILSLVLWSLKEWMCLKNVGLTAYKDQRALDCFL